MTKADSIFSFLNSIAPIDTQENYDNSGFLLGSSKKDVKKVLVSLDATSDVIREAEENNCELIITHHPLIWGSFKNILEENIIGNKLISLIKKDISVISMHTNLDKALVNDVLIRALGVSEYESVVGLEFMKMGRLTKPISMGEFLPVCKSALRSGGLRYYDSGKAVHKIACIGGAGEDGLKDAFNAGCDTFITADIKYHVFLDAKEMGINLIDGDHFCTENPAMNVLVDKLNEEFPEVEFMLSKKHYQVIQYA